MSGSTVRRQVDLLISGALSRPAIAAVFAKECRRQRDAVIHSGQAPAVFDTYTDGILGAPEENTKIGGTVAYVFSILGQAAAYAYSFAVARSPTVSGRYRQNWVVAVNGADYADDLEDIPSNSTVIIVNRVPYARKIDVGAGHVKITAGSHITEDAQQAVRRRFPSIDVQRIFVDLPSSLSRNGIVVPYVGRLGALTYPAVQLSTSTR